MNANCLQVVSLARVIIAVYMKFIRLIAGWTCTFNATLAVTSSIGLQVAHPRHLEIAIDQTSWHFQNRNSLNFENAASKIKCCL
jgi:hypothetical protein